MSFLGIFCNFMVSFLIVVFVYFTEGDQEGVLDGLLEALDTGSAFQK